MHVSPGRMTGLPTGGRFLACLVVLFSWTVVGCSSERGAGEAERPSRSTQAPGRPADPAAGVPDQPSGSNLAPIRTVQDTYPVFYDIGVDPANDFVLVSDANKFSIRTYSRSRQYGTRVAEPLTAISGPTTQLDFVCGVDVDPMARELLVVENDTGAELSVFPYNAKGNVAPLRKLSAAGRGIWGVSVDRIHDEVAVSVEHENRVSVYRREAEGDEKPLRTIQGPSTGLTDPHGVFLDGINNEIIVANHDSWGGGAGDDTGSGKFVPFSITVYRREENGDVKPLRTIQGPATQLVLPMKLHVDTVNNEIAVANGDDSVLMFSRTANGNAAPLRRIHGPSTGLANPTGVYIDVKNNEVWVANPGDHSLKVFPRTADGDVKPKRIVRAAPMGTPAVGIGNPGGIAYDSKRDQLLVPN
jgi:DNA-binding beta-propeller fold protein YncE